MTRFTIIGGSDFVEPKKSQPNTTEDDSPPRRRYKRRYQYSERPLVTKGGLNMRTSAFRGYDTIAESTEADLIHDVGLDLHKAQIKLKRARKRLQSLRDQVDIMTHVETKLSAAIVEALLSRKRGG